MPKATGGAVPPPATIERLIQSMTAWPGRGDDALAVLNGPFGDAWAEQQSVLAVPMTVRTAMGDELPLERDAMRHMLHDAGPTTVRVRPWAHVDRVGVANLGILFAVRFAAGVKVLVDPDEAPPASSA